MPAFVGVAGGCHSKWTERRAILHQMLVLAGDERYQTTGFLALTDRQGSSGQPKVISDKAAVPAHRFAARSQPWASLRRSSLVLAHTSALPNFVPLRAEVIPPFSSPDDRCAVIQTGEMPVTANLTDRAAGAGPDPTGILRYIADSVEPGGVISGVLAQTTGPMTCAVLWPRHGALHIAHRGDPLWINRLHGHSCWFVSPDGDTFAEALERVYGPDAPRIEVSLPVASASVLTLTAHGSCFLHAQLPTLSTVPLCRPQNLL